MAYFRCSLTGSGSGATITASYDSSIYGKTITCTDGVKTLTKTAASTGSTVFNVPNGGTWTLSVVDSGVTYSQQVVVVTDYSCTIVLWRATVNITTPNSDLYSQTITVKKGGSTVGSTSFDSSGSATYIAPETGEYTFECTYDGTTYSASVSVTAETTYSVVISMELTYEIWLTEGGLDPSDYADLSEVLADEEAVRRLMTIHDSVDYLATAAADDQMMETIIADDICAKWINLRDYAFDTLSANSDIKDVMDEVDKYGYGEWVLEGQVPVMTSATAPYGEVSASGQYSTAYADYKAFTDISDGYGWLANNQTNAWIKYKAINPFCMKRLSIDQLPGSGTDYYTSITFKLQGSNDDSTYVDIQSLTITNANTVNYFDINNNDFYLYYKLLITDFSPNIDGKGRGFKFQFYAYQPKGNVPIMTSNTAPYGEAISAGTKIASWVPDVYNALGDVKTTSRYTILSLNGSVKDCYVGYRFNNPACVRRVFFGWSNDSTITGNCQHAIEGSNDETNWNTLETFETQSPSSGGAYFIKDVTFNNNEYYLYYRLRCNNTIPNWKSSGSQGYCVGLLQFYGREKKVSVPPNSFSFDYSERDWDTTNPRKYIYDHGVELEEVTLAGTASKEEYDVKLIASNDQASKTLDTTDYDLLRAVVGKYASGTNVLFAGSGNATFTAANMPYNQSLDVSSINGDNAVGVKQTSTGIFTAEEWWLE